MCIHGYQYAYEHGYGGVGARGAAEGTLAPMTGRHPLTRAQFAELCSQRPDIVDEQVSRMLLHQAGPVGVVFSGGLDSALLARALQLAGAEPVLYTVAQPGSADLLPARAFAAHCGLPLVERQLDLEQLRSDLVQRMRHHRSHADGHFALVLLLEEACRAMAADGCAFAWSGVGADVAFAGGETPATWGVLDEEWPLRYWRHTLAMWSWRHCHLDADPHEMALPTFSPFSQLATLRLARRIPPRLLWEGEHDKVPVRHLAARLGVPDGIAWRGKEPAQRSSGVMGMLTELMYEDVAERLDMRAANPIDPRLDVEGLARSLWFALVAERAGVERRTYVQPRTFTDWQGPDPAT